MKQQTAVSIGTIGHKQVPGDEYLSRLIKKMSKFTHAFDEVKFPIDEEGMKQLGFIKIPNSATRYIRTISENEPSGKVIKQIVFVHPLGHVRMIIGQERDGLIHGQVVKRAYGSNVGNTRLEREFWGDCAFSCNHGLGMEVRYVPISGERNAVKGVCIMDQIDDRHIEVSESGGKKLITFDRSSGYEVSREGLSGPSIESNFLKVEGLTPDVVNNLFSLKNNASDKLAFLGKLEKAIGQSRYRDEWKNVARNLVTRDSHGDLVSIFCAALDDSKQDVEIYSDGSWLMGKFTNGKLNGFGILRKPKLNERRWPSMMSDEGGIPRICYDVTEGVFIDSQHVITLSKSVYDSMSEEGRVNLINETKKIRDQRSGRVEEVQKVDAVPQMPALSSVTLPDTTLPLPAIESQSAQADSGRKKDEEMQTNTAVSRQDQYQQTDENFENELEALSGEISRLQQQATRQSDLERTAGDLRKLVTEKDLETKRVRGGQARLEAQKNELKQKFEELQREIDAVSNSSKKENDDLLRTNRVQEKELLSLREENSRLQRELETRGVELKRKDDELRAQRQVASDHDEAIVKQMQNLMKEVESYRRLAYEIGAGGGFRFEQSRDGDVAAAAADGNADPVQLPDSEAQPHTNEPSLTGSSTTIPVQSPTGSQLAARVVIGERYRNNPYAKL